MKNGACIGHGAEVSVRQPYVVACTNQDETGKCVQQGPKKKQKISHPPQQQNQNNTATTTTNGMPQQHPPNYFPTHRFGMMNPPYINPDDLSAPMKQQQQLLFDVSQKTQHSRALLQQHQRLFDMSQKTKHSRAQLHGW